MNNLIEQLQKQKHAFKQDGFPAKEIRIDRLTRLINMLKKYDQDICQTIATDFGNRPHELSRMTEVMATIDHAKHAIESLESWMQPEKRQALAPASDAGASAEIHFQPKGVVGIIGPWNFPVHLVLAPLVCVLASGNRAMIKPSSITPKTSKLLAKMVAEFFEPSEVFVVEGENISRQFTKLPFNHIVFTGSTENGRHVMRAAAANLTPVTLELGGKSPVIIDKEIDIDVVAKRLMTGKLFNSGQVCVCPDYAFVPKEILPQLLIAIEAAITSLYPTIKNNPEYTSIVNEHHFQRVKALINDAKEKGVRMIKIDPANEAFDEKSNRKIYPRILINPADDCSIMQDEIFGPLLPIKTYNNITEVVNYLNHRDNPLALYYFGENKQTAKTLAENVLAGGMTNNDVIVQVLCNQIPFGGVGQSGMGCYHGIEGFKEFSHAKPVYTQTPVEEIVSFTRSPYKDELRAMMTDTIANA